MESISNGNGMSINTLNEIYYFHFENADQNYELKPNRFRETYMSKIKSVCKEKERM